MSGYAQSVIQPIGIPQGRNRVSELKRALESINNTYRTFTIGNNATIGHWAFIKKHIQDLESKNAELLLFHRAIVKILAGNDSETQKLKRIDDYCWGVGKSGSDTPKESTGNDGQDNPDSN